MRESAIQFIELLPHVKGEMGATPGDALRMEPHQISSSNRDPLASCRSDENPAALENIYPASRKTPNRPTASAVGLYMPAGDGELARKSTRWPPKDRRGDRYPTPAPW